MSAQPNVAELPPRNHNNPPEDTPFEAAKERVELYYEEAKLWLDGEPITTQEQADDLSNLLNLIREAEKQADEARKEENRPFDEGKAAVQAKYAPLIGNTKAVKGKTVLAAEMIKKALQPWLDEQDRQRREEAERARQEADAKQRAAQEAIQKARQEAADLAQREDAERLAEEAKQAERAASKASKTTAKASGGVGRAASLRTSYEAKIVDEREFAAFVWKHHHDELVEWMQQLADRLVRNKQRGIPGVEVIERKVVV